MIPDYTPEHEYCLFTCCTTAYDAAFSDRSRQPPGPCPQLLTRAGINFGTLGLEEVCCGDPAHNLGDQDPVSGVARPQHPPVSKPAGQEDS